MADDKGGKNVSGNWMKHIWNDLTKPPKWMKEPQKPGSSQSSKKDDGKKAEADASKRPKKRQPPSWWSWSGSDGVPAKSNRKKRSGHATTKPQSRRPEPKGGKGSPLSPLTNSQSDLGSSKRPALTDLNAQFRRHGYAPAVLKPYGFDVQKLEPFGPVLRLRTNKGLVALKKSYLQPREIQFLHEATVHLETNKFTKVSPFLLTTDGKPYAQVGGDTYYATRWIRGQEVNFRSMPQVALASRTLAEFHEASRGYETKGYRPAMIFDMVDRFSDRKDELQAWKKRAKTKSRPDKVDSLFLKHVDLYIKQCNDALVILKRKEVRAHLLFEEDDPVLCHLDLTPYNMVYTTDGQVCLIDLDFSTFGPRTLDLAHLMRRALQRQEWEEDVARHMLVNYNAVRILTREEYLILHGLLLFPHRFWRIAYQHYELGHDPHHLGYFELAEAEEEKRQAFLTKFGRQVERIWR